MRIQSAVIIAQGITFMVVAVPKSVLDDQRKAEQTIHFLQARWVGMPIALVTCDAHGSPMAYYGSGIWRCNSSESRPRRRPGKICRSHRMLRLGAVVCPQTR
jgi:hypothetical protein